MAIKDVVGVEVVVEVVFNDSVTILKIKLP
jgi:hypothetical protein